jgi:hypothetical protein
MKILLLATPRSGSTSLTSLIGEHLKKENYKTFYEPFNPRFYNNYLSNGYDFKTYEPLTKFDNLIVKSILMDGLNEYPLNSFDNINDYLDWCINYFDKVFILDRSNKIEQSESFVINETANRTTGIGWHTPKVYNVKNMDMNFYNNILNILNKTQEQLIHLSENNNLPYFLYENIFTDSNQSEIEKLFNYLEIIDRNKTH